MTREEAITVLQDKHDECKAFYDLAAHPEDAYPGAKEYMEALQIAIAALRGPTREQVEALRGEILNRITKIPDDFSCPFVECTQYAYCSTKICSRWEAWFTDTWSKIHKQGLEAIERRKLNEHPSV